MKLPGRVRTAYPADAAGPYPLSPRVIHNRPPMWR